MAFDISTRGDLVRRRTIPVNTGTFWTGRWASIDANGYAAAPTAVGSRNVYITVLGNEARPDSQALGGKSIAVAYGINLFTLETMGIASTISSVGTELCVNTNGDLVTCSTPGLTVAIAENTKNIGVSGLEIRTLQ